MTTNKSIENVKAQYTSDNKHFTVYGKQFMFGLMDVVFHYDLSGARYTIAWAGDSKEITRRVYRNNRLIHTTIYA